MNFDLALLSASRRSWLDSSAPRVGPYWLRCVWTFLFCATLAVGFTVLGFLVYARDATGAWRDGAGWLHWYGKNLVVTLTIGTLIQLTFDALSQLWGGLQRVHRWPAWQRTAFFSGVPLLCTAVGWPIGVSLAGAQAFGFARMGANAIVGSVLLSLVLTYAFHQYFAVQQRQIEAEKRAAEAQLRLLQGQIEPHFLFNTLANVISLIDHDTPKAKQMLESFTDYLRASLTSLRVEQATLGGELDLVQHYLGLLKTRMENRLHFSICSPEALRDWRLPPLLLQPLVENAIHHGLEPKVEGGQVRVSVQRQGEHLLIAVADDGLGLHAPPRRQGGAGMALNNLRERLLAHYGSAASLTLADAHPGTVATLRLPIQIASQKAAA
jgi:hypothetical protein